MELEKKYIYQVYQCGSFSKAAEALFITQPALSIAIKKVEQEIGAAIFNRSQRPLTLTSIGELYLHHPDHPCPGWPPHHDRMAADMVGHRG